MYGRRPRCICSALPVVKSHAGATENGIVKVKSNYGLAETVAHLKQDVGAKGFKFFQEIDQSKLAADANIKINPSTLLVFGNPPLGKLFIKANPVAGLDWPVRLPVYRDDSGAVWATYSISRSLVQQCEYITDSLLHPATGEGTSSRTCSR